MSIPLAMALGASIGFLLWSAAPALDRLLTALLNTPPGRALVAAWELIRFDIPDLLRRWWHHP